MYYRGKEGELETFVVTLSGFIYIIWQFVVYLCNVNQQNAHFLNLCFISIFHVFYVFRTSRFIFRNTICTCCFVICFSCIYVSSLAGGRICSILNRVKLVNNKP